jgi:hypothetical protein
MIISMIWILQNPADNYVKTQKSENTEMLPQLHKLH